MFNAGLLSSHWNIYHSTTAYFFEPPCIFQVSSKSVWGYWSPRGVEICLYHYFSYWFLQRPVLPNQPRTLKWAVGVISEFPTTTNVVDYTLPRILLPARSHWCGRSWQIFGGTASEPEYSRPVEQRNFYLPYLHFDALIGGDPMGISPRSLETESCVCKPRWVLPDVGFCTLVSAGSF